MVSREALREAIWGDDTFVDFDRGLNFCIAQIRAALGDSVESPRFIRTIPKRGYQFFAPVERVDAVAAEPAGSSPVPPSGDRRADARKLAVALLVGLAPTLLKLITATLVVLTLGVSLPGLRKRLTR